MDESHIKSILAKHDYDLLAYDKEGMYPSDLVHALLEYGVFEDENADLIADFAEGADRIEMLAEICSDGGVNFSLSASLLAGCRTLKKYASDSQLENLLNKPLSHAVIANAMTEAHSGSDAFNMKTKASKNGDNYVLNGVKTFVSNAKHADLCVVYAITDQEKGAFGGISAFVLHPSQYMVAREFETMGLRTCSLSEITLNDVEVTSAQMLGKEGAGTAIFMDAMIEERIGLCSMHLGTMKRLWKETNTFVRSRGGEDKIVSHPSIKSKLTEMYLLMDVCRMHIDEGLIAIEDNEDKLLRSSICKFQVSEAFVKFCQIALQIFAGNGYTKDYDVERILRDAQASTIYSGSNDIQISIIQKHLKL